MEEELRRIEEIADDLENRIKEEEKLIIRLVEVTKDNLSGLWQHSNSDRPDFREHKIKIKIKGMHMLIDLDVFQTKKILSVSLWKSVVESTYKGKPNFRNDEVANGWKKVRDHVDIKTLVTSILKALEEKLSESKKQDLDKLDGMLDAAQNSTKTT